MAARTVVVQAPRRRLFSILWQLPRWLRAVASRSPRRPPPSTPAATAVAVARAGSRRPGLLWTLEGGHRCVGCGLCIDACPGRALTLELAERAAQVEPTVWRKGKKGTKGTKDAPPARGPIPSATARVRRFELAPGRCIGCGLCIELCPETALLRVEGAALVGPGPEPERWSLVDLLQAAPA